MIKDTLFKTNQMRQDLVLPKLSKYLSSGSADVMHRFICPALISESESGKSATEAAAFSASSLLHFPFVGHRIC